MSLAPYRAGPCPNSNTLPRAYFNRFGNLVFVFVFAFVFVFDFSSLFAIAPFVVAVFAIGRAANGQNSWRQSGSTARRKAEAPPKRSRSAVEPEPNTWRAIRVGSLWLWLQLIFSRDGLRFVVRESFRVNFVLTFHFFCFCFRFRFLFVHFFCAFSLQPAELSRVAVAAGFAQVSR